MHCKHARVTSHIVCVPYICSCVLCYTSSITTMCIYVGIYVSRRTQPTYVYASLCAMLCIDESFANMFIYNCIVALSLILQTCITHYDCFSTNLSTSSGSGNCRPGKQYMSHLQQSCCSELLLGERVT